MAICVPPSHPEGRPAVWRAESPSANEPYGPPGGNVTRSLTLKRPVGVGLSGLPAATGIVASVRRTRAVPGDSPHVHAERRAVGRLVELGVDAAKRLLTVLVGALHLGPADRKRQPHRTDRTEAGPPPARPLQQLEVDLGREDLLH